MEDSPFITYFLQTYEPAQSMTDASITLSTVEIAQQFLQHTGMGCEYSVLYQWLWDKGFRYEDIGDLNFVWLLKRQD